MTDLCNAKTRAGTPCQQPAGWGTAHVGQGRCKLHGGSAGRPPTHGRYSVAKRAALSEKIEQFRNDPQAGDLRDELAVLRALLEDYLNRFDDNQNLTGADIMLIYTMIDNIGKLVERIAKILAMTALTQAELQFLQVMLIDTIKEFIPDPERQRAFVARIAGTMGQSMGASPGSLPGSAINIGDTE